MTKKELTKKIIELLTEGVPDVQWLEAVIGIRLGKGVVGTVACDRVSFEYPSKDIIDATAVFTVVLIDVNGSEAMDDRAEQVMKLLRANPTIDGAAIDSGVQRIIYGTPQGAPKATAAEITYEVLYDGT